ncbi:hypothetical protein ASF83_06400 [Plantibacter sp. Leaf171]|nr:hypothetical protein ASE44_06415 [Plantibacter sp. Leaf1]KQR58724.1 hypothetical protein ASF83_06400 [Plantibacter sp. Leaf171]
MDDVNDATNARNRTTLRSTSGYWILGVTALLMVFFIIDAVGRGAWGFALLALPWELLVVWLVYLVLVRPCIVIEPERLTIVNVGRLHEIPWSRLEEATSRYQLTVLLRDGRKITSWGAPSAGLDRPSLTGGRGRRDVDHQERASGVRRPGRAGNEGPSAVDLIDRAHERWGKIDPADTRLAASRWDVVALGVTAALMVWGAASALLG